MDVSALNSATYGINQSIGLMNRTAQNVANGSNDLATDAVNQIVAKDSLTANSAVFSTYDEMMQELVHLADQRRAQM